MSDIRERLADYLKSQADIRAHKKAIKDLSAQAKTLEADIMEYMTQHSMDEIRTDGGHVVLYNKKVPQTFKKESIVHKLDTVLGDSKKAEHLANAILQNKTYTLKEQLKAVFKKGEKDVNST